MENGNLVKIEITDITGEGRGVGRTKDGITVFVKGAIPGDIVNAELTKVKKRYAFACVKDFEKKSPYRIENYCKYQNQCGGCAFGEVQQEKEITLKENRVRETISRIAGIENPNVAPIISTDNLFNYRNKAVMAVSPEKGEGIIGFFSEKSHKVIDCRDCRLQSKPAMAAAEILRKFMKKEGISGYNRKYKRGLIRNLVVRTAVGTGEVMILIVVNGKEIPNIEKLVLELDEAITGMEDFYSLESVVININRKDATVLYGDKTNIVAGKPTIKEEIGDMKFEISPLAFFQVNPLQMEKLYNKAFEYAKLQGGEKILDIYCGGGTIGLWMLQKMRKTDRVGFETTSVLGIESNKSAILDANRNAVINGFVNARYLHGKAEEILTNNKDFLDNVELAIVDPPRSGCREDLLESLIKASPGKLIYISCDVGTFARDAKILTESGYKLVETTPVEMFPNTGSIETCSLLVKTREAKSELRDDSSPERSKQ